MTSVLSITMTAAHPTDCGGGAKNSKERPQPVGVHDISCLFVHIPVV